MKQLLFTLALIISGGLTTCLSAQTVLVVNKNNPVTSLSKAQVKKLLMGQTTKWPSGAVVSAMLTAQGSPERKKAVTEICGMTENDFTTFFLKANFQGQSVQAPKSLPSSQAIIQITQLVPGAVAFVNQADVTPEVKVVSIAE